MLADVVWACCAQSCVRSLFFVPVFRYGQQYKQTSQTKKVHLHGCTVYKLIRLEKQRFQFVITDIES